MDKKVERVLNIYDRLLAGEIIHKGAEAERFQVNVRTIQRDLEDIRAYFAENPEVKLELKYDRNKKGYHLYQRDRKTLTNGEILTVCKILLESQALVKDEMYNIIEKFILSNDPYCDVKRVNHLISNEKFHYLEPKHSKKLVEQIWELSSAITDQQILLVSYHDQATKKLVKRMIQPVGLLCSECNFYLAAYFCNEDACTDMLKSECPAVFRLDRLDEYEVLGDHFRVVYKDRFEEGEFKKKLYENFSNKPTMLKFRYTGDDVSRIFMRFPTAEIVEHDQNGWLFSAHTNGVGAIIWLMGQDDKVEILEGAELPACVCPVN